MLLSPAEGARHFWSEALNIRRQSRCSRERGRFLSVCTRQHNTVHLRKRLVSWHTYWLRSFLGYGRAGRLVVSRRSKKVLSLRLTHNLARVLIYYYYGVFFWSIYFMCRWKCGHCHCTGVVKIISHEKCGRYSCFMEREWTSWSWTLNFPPINHTVLVILACRAR